MGASEETAGDKIASGYCLKGLAFAAAAVGLLVSGLIMPPAVEAAGETRTMTLYSVNTKEKLTTTYMVNGKHVASELAKINHLLRDWRRNAVTKIDPKTIDLVWELHADLGSKAPIHVVSGYRAAETNALLKNIGRNVAKRSMHIQGKAIDLYFPDVPIERLRNSALVREVGGVGYYPRSGPSGFIHVDSGRVRHWPGIGQDQIARIRRDYRKTVGARLGRGQAVQVASAETPAPAEEGYFAPMPRPRPIEVLMMAAAQTIVQPVAAPAPVHNFSGAAAASRAAKPVIEPQRDLAVAGMGIAPKVDLAVADMTIGPVAAPVPAQNFGERASLVRDTLETELAPGVDTDLVVAQVFERPRPGLAMEGSFLAALGDGIAAGAEDLLSWPVELIRGAGSLIWRGDTMQVATAGPASAPVEEASEPFPPITDEDEAELEVIIAALRSRAQYDARNARSDRSAAFSPAASRPSAKGDRLSVVRARKGDLILTAPIPRYGAAVQPAEQVAVQATEKLPGPSGKVQ